MRTVESSTLARRALDLLPEEMWRTVVECCVERPPDRLMNFLEIGEDARIDKEYETLLSLALICRALNVSSSHLLMSSSLRR